MNIRRACINDVEAITAELSRHIAACKVHYPDPDKASVARTILSGFHHTAPMVAFVAEGENGIVGIASAVVSQYLWSPQVQCEIRLVYVAPEHRGGTTFARLMQAVEAWAKDKGAAEMSFTLSTGVDDETTADCLGKRGWKRAGVDMVRTL